MRPDSPSSTVAPSRPVTTTVSPGGWSSQGEDVLAVARSGDSGYAYVSTPGADAPGTDVRDRDPHASRCDPAGAVVRFNATNGDVEWRSALPTRWSCRPAPRPSPLSRTRWSLPAASGSAHLRGGRRCSALTQNVVALGKSRSYALPGAIQQVVIWDPAGEVTTTPGCSCRPWLER